MAKAKKPAVNDRNMKQKSAKKGGAGKSPVSKKRKRHESVDEAASPRSSKRLRRTAASYSENSPTSDAHEPTASKVSSSKGQNKRRKRLSSHERTGDENGETSKVVNKRRTRWPGRWQCEHCALKFDRQYDYDKHLGQQHGEWKLKCAECGRGFLQPADLKKHMRVHTGTSSVSCEVCGKGLRDTASLKLHMRTHTKSKPFACSFCGKQFSHKWDLQNHENVIHKGELRYECEVCKRRFGVASSLAYHRKAKHGEDRGATCDVCGRYFKKKAFLAKHQHNFHGIGNPDFEEKPFYQCSQCDLKFQLQRDCKSHQLTHLDRLRKCRICMTTFPTTVAMFTHMVKAHSSSSSDPCKVNDGDSSSTAVPSSPLKTRNCRNKRVRVGDDDVKDGLLRQQVDVSSLPLDGSNPSNESTSVEAWLVSAADQFPCERCEEMFTSSLACSRHYIAAHGFTSVQCDKCEESFERPVALERHLARHKRESALKPRQQNATAAGHLPRTQQSTLMFSCAPCYQHFNTSLGYKRHMNTHKSHIKCKYCRATFPHVIALSTHLAREHRDDVRSERVAIGVDDDNMSSAVSPNCEITGGLQQTCTTDGETLNDEARSIQPEYRCETCDLSFTLEASYTQHMESHPALAAKNDTLVSSHHLPLDGAPPSDDSAPVEAQMEVAADQFACERCEETFTSSLARSRHYIAAHGLTSLQCEMCPIRFKTPVSLERHLTRHKKDAGGMQQTCATDGANVNEGAGSSQPEYRCETCDLSFTLEASYTQHMESHPALAAQNDTLVSSHHLPLDGAPPSDDSAPVEAQMEAAADQFACARCEETFTSSLARSRHYIAAHGLTSLQCEKCAESFKTPVRLERHLTRHRKEAVQKLQQGAVPLTTPLVTNQPAQKFECPPCGLQFPCGQSFQGHMNTHKNYIKCKYCKTTLPHMVALSKHLVQKHRDDVRSEGVDIRLSDGELDSETSIHSPKTVGYYMGSRSVKRIDSNEEVASHGTSQQMSNGSVKLTTSPTELAHSSHVSGQTILSSSCGTCRGKFLTHVDSKQHLAKPAHEDAGGVQQRCATDGENAKEEVPGRQSTYTEESSYVHLMDTDPAAEATMELFSPCQESNDPFEDKTCDQGNETIAIASTSTEQYSQSVPTPYLGGTPELLVELSQMERGSQVHSQTVQDAALSTGFSSHSLPAEPLHKRENLAQSVEGSNKEQMLELPVKSSHKDQSQELSAGPSYKEENVQLSVASSHKEESQMPSVVSSQKEGSQVPLFDPSQKEESQVLSADPSEKEVTQVPSVDPSKKEETQVPSVSPSQGEQSQVPSVDPSQDEQSQVPVVDPSQKEEGQLPSIELSHKETRSPSVKSPHNGESKVPSIESLRKEKGHVSSVEPSREEGSEQPSVGPSQKGESLELSVHSHSQVVEAAPKEASSEQSVELSNLVERHPSEKLQHTPVLAELFSAHAQSVGQSDREENLAQGCPKQSVASVTSKESCEHAGKKVEDGNTSIDLFPSQSQSVRPSHEEKIYHPDGRVEDVASAAEALSSHLSSVELPRKEEDWLHLSDKVVAPSAEQLSSRSQFVTPSQESIEQRSQNGGVTTSSVGLLVSCSQTVNAVNCQDVAEQPDEGVEVTASEQLMDIVENISEVIPTCDGFDAKVGAKSDKSYMNTVSVNRLLCKKPVNVDSVDMNETIGDVVNNVQPSVASFNCSPEVKEDDPPCDALATETLQHTSLELGNSPKDDDEDRHLVYQNGDHESSQCVSSQPSSVHVSDMPATSPYLNNKQKDVVRCDMCGDVFPSMLARSHHLLSFHGVLSVHCDLCDESFRTPVALERHRLRHRGPTHAKIPTGPTAMDRNANIIDDSLKSAFKLDPSDHKCQMCLEVFSTTLVLFRHYISSHDLSSLQCQICSNIYYTPVTMEKHKITCVSSAPQQARSVLPLSQIIKVGSDIVKVPSGLGGSEVNGSGVTPFKCELCSEKFPSSITLSRHYLSDHHMSSLACDKCDESFKTPVALERHRMRHVGDTLLSPLQPTSDGAAISQSPANIIPGLGISRVETAFCRTEVRQNAVSTRDIQSPKIPHAGADITAEQSSNLCLSDIDECLAPVCQTSDDYNNESSNSQASQSPVTDVKCQFCIKTFLTMIARSQHYMSDHGMTSLPCDQCHESFPTPVALERHHVRGGCNQSQSSMRWRAPPSPAPRAITVNNQLKEEEEEFTCTVCGQVFAYSLMLSHHYVTIHNFASLSCKRCDETFTTPIAFETHRALHHRLDNRYAELEPEVIKAEFTCDSCHKHFATVLMWAQHLITVHRLTSFQCGICTSSFTTPIGLEKHILTHNFA